MQRRIAALVRHGDYHQRAGVPSAHQPYGLTDEGEAQAHDAAALLSTMSRDVNATLSPVIDCSPLLRAWSTASIIASEMPSKPAVESFDALAERGLGAAANLTVDEIAHIVSDDPRYDPPPENWKSDSHYRLPFLNAESLMESGERIADHIRSRIAALPGPYDIVKVFVGHGAAFRHAAFRLGALEFPDIARLSMYHARPILLEQGGDGKWRQVAGEWKTRPSPDRNPD